MGETRGRERRSQWGQRQSEQQERADKAARNWLGDVERERKPSWLCSKLLPLATALARPAPIGRLTACITIPWMAPQPIKGFLATLHFGFHFHHGNTTLFLALDVACVHTHTHVHTHKVERERNKNIQYKVDQPLVTSSSQSNYSASTEDISKPQQPGLDTWTCGIECVHRAHGSWPLSPVCLINVNWNQFENSLYRWWKLYYWRAGVPPTDNPGNHEYPLTQR